jgi:transposase
MPSETTIPVAIELSVSSWLVAARPPGAEKSRLHHIEGGDTTALLALIAELHTRASTKLGKPAEVVYCFEVAGTGSGCTERRRCTPSLSTCSSRPASR